MMMTEQRYSLCPACDACPEVVIAEDAVTIGEHGNQVRLAAQEWDVLVEAVRTGELGPVGAASTHGKQCDCGCECC